MKERCTLFGIKPLKKDKDKEAHNIAQNLLITKMLSQNARPQPLNGNNNIKIHIALPSQPKRSPTNTVTIHVIKSHSANEATHTSQDPNLTFIYW